MARISDIPVQIPGVLVDLIAQRVATVVVAELLRRQPKPRPQQVQVAELSEPRVPQTFIRLKELVQRIGVGRSTVYKWIEEGSFPKPVHLGPHAVAWLVTDIVEWEQSKLLVDPT